MVPADSCKDSHQYITQGTRSLALQPQMLLRPIETCFRYNLVWALSCSLATTWEMYYEELWFKITLILYNVK